MGGWKETTAVTAGTAEYKMFESWKEAVFKVANQKYVTFTPITFKK